MHRRLEAIRAKSAFQYILGMYRFMILDVLRFTTLDEDRGQTIQSRRLGILGRTSWTYTSPWNRCRRIPGLRAGIEAPFARLYGDIARRAAECEELQPAPGMPVRSGMIGTPESPDW